MIDVGNKLQHTVANLIDDQLYYFAVTAYNEFGESEFSEEISFRTIVNTENVPPTADAGADQSADEGDLVLLDGSYSSDPDDGVAAYLWEQIEGTPVVLSDSSAIEPNFTCPEANTAGEKLTFRLTVTDHGSLSAADVVDIYVNDIVYNPGVEYCESTNLVFAPWWIGNVTFGNFSMSSTASSYSDFTSEVIEVQKAESYLVSLSAEPATPFFKYWRMWADLNRDGDFDDPGEKLLESSGGDSVVTRQITVPATAPGGNTRLRVSMGSYGYPDPCGNIYYGEVEDYTLNIQ